MTTLAGKTLLFLACFWIGLDRTRRRRERTAWLRAFRQAVADLGRELTFSFSPVDGLLAGAEEKSGPAAAFFQACRSFFRESGGESWADSWNSALETVSLPIREEDRVLLARAGEIIGRWDGETQQRALAELLSRLDEIIFDGTEEEKRLFRVDLALGVTAGLFCVLLL